MKIPLEKPEQRVAARVFVRSEGVLQTRFG